MRPDGERAAAISRESALTKLSQQAKIPIMMNSRQDNPLQSSSLSTYIGYITGPRAEQPVGVRVVEPPPGTRQNQRGSLYAVVEVAGDHPDRAAIVDRLLSEVQRVYYSAKGSQSQVMSEAVQQTQQLLREINAHTPHYPLQLGIACAALLGGKLLIGTSGPAFALMSVSGKVHMFPSEPSMNAGGYGSAPIEVHRQDVRAEDTLFLGGGSWLRRVPTRTLASIIAFTNADNCSDAADELYEQAGRMQVPGLLIVLGAGANNEPPRSGGYGGGYSGGGGYPSTPSGSSGGSSGGAPAPRKPRFSTLPTAVNTTPPARLPADPTIPPSASTTLAAAAAATALTQPSPSAAPDVDSAPLSQGQSSSGQSDAISTGVPARGSPQEWEPPPPEALKAAPDVGSSPSSSPQAMVDEPTVESPPEQSRSAEAINKTQTAQEQTAHKIASNEPLEQESLVDEQTHQPYSVSPLEEESFGGDLPVEPGDEYDPIFPASSEQEVAERAPKPVSWLVLWRAQASQGLGQARDFFSSMLPERQKSASGTEWQEIGPEGNKQGAAPAKKVRPRYNEVDASVATAAVASQTRRTVTPPSDIDFDEEEEDNRAATPPPVLDVSPFAPPKQTRGARARLFLLISLVVVILVPIVVVAVNYGQGNSRREKAEQLTARAQLVLLGGQSALDGGDKVTARERLTEAKDYLAQAIELDGSNDNRAQLIATIESELQDVLQIIPLYGLTAPLITFPPDARPQHVLVMNEDIFVIDDGRKALLQYRYDPKTNTVPDQKGQVLLREGDQVGGVTVGTLADMAWLPLIPGFEDRPSLLITDRNNNVFRYDERVDGASLMPFADRGSWGSIGQIQTYNGRIYIADEAKGNLMRFEPGQFDQPGKPWFSPDTPVNLADLVSMEIDGDVWLLFKNGMIMRYREGEQVPFSPENSIGLAEQPVDMYVTHQDNSNVYLVDAGQDRILVYDKNGAYVGQLRAPEDDLLRGLSGIYIDEVGGVMYILTQTGLFSHPVLP